MKDKAVQPRIARIARIPFLGKTMKKEAGIKNRKYQYTELAKSVVPVFVFYLWFNIRNSIVRVFDILFYLFSVFSVSLCCISLSLIICLFFSSLPETRERILSMKKSNPFQHTASKVFSINPGTAGLFRTVGCTYFVSAVHRERTVFCTLFRSHSRSGRRGRLRRHTRDNMASRENGSGNSFSKGGHSPLFHIVWGNALCSFSMCKKRGKDFLPSGHSPLFRHCLGRCALSHSLTKNHKSFAEDFSPPLSSPGVCSTNPPAKPTGMFFRPNRQWCGALRGGGEGSPRARVSFEQQERTCFKPSAIISSVADRQQRGRFSKHRRAAGSTARTRASRIMDLLEMEKWHDFHIREDQQNMGTGNAHFQRCLYPFLRPDSQQARDPLSTNGPGGSCCLATPPMAVAAGAERSFRTVSLSHPRQHNRA